MSDTENTIQTPPYLPYSTFTSFFGELQGGIPNRIDRSFLSSKSGTIQTYLISTLKFFGLISENGTPTKRLKQMVEAEVDERNKLLGDLVREFYPEIFDGSLDFENATQGQLDEKFTGEYGVQGDTRRKVVSFFMLAAKDGGIGLSPHLRKTRKRAAGATRRKRKNGKLGEAPARPAQTISTPVAESIPALEEKLIIGLIEKLPAPGQPFSADDQKLWIDMAQMVFKMVYRVTDDDAPE